MVHRVRDGYVGCGPTGPCHIVTEARMTLVRRITLVTTVAAGAALLAAAPAQAAPTAQDSGWLKSAHQYNLTEIAAGQAAQSRASSATVKELGAMFVSDHTTGDAALRAKAQLLGVSLPSAPDAMQQSELAQAKAASGAAFDAVFLRQQTAGHRQALAAGKAELAAGSDSRVLAVARMSGPTVQKHLDELLAAQASSSPTGVNAGTGGQAATNDSAPVGVGVAALGLALLAGAGTIVLRRARASA